MMFLRLEKKPFVKEREDFFCVQKSRYLQCAQAPSSPLTGEPSFQSRPVGVGQIEGVIT